MVFIFCLQLRLSVCLYLNKGGNVPAPLFVVFTGIADRKCSSG